MGQDVSTAPHRSVVVYAIGGHALKALDGSGAVAAEALTPVVEDVIDLLESGHRVLVTHGNGPQVGDLLLMEERARPDGGTTAIDEGHGLDDWVAATQGMIGHQLALRLDAILERRGRPERCSVIVTRVVVKARDPAFAAPTKPIGPVIPPGTEVPETWVVGETSRGPRRLVASPRPVRVLDEPTIRTLLAAGALVVAGGGGGIPVAWRRGRLDGMAAVIDKDRLAAEMALACDAGALVITTDVDAVQRGFGTAAAESLTELTSTEVAAGLADGTFPAGSMGPKLEALAHFATERPAGKAVVCSPGSALLALRGRSGTRIVA